MVVVSIVSYRHNNENCWLHQTPVDSISIIDHNESDCAMIFGVYTMATLTVRQFDDDLKEQLRIKAAHNHRSMEAEVRAILKSALSSNNIPASGLGSAIHKLFKEKGSIDLQLPHRSMAREIPDFS